tara:strand:+ start:41 stop:736 length:696 start_codon:yes stop_codon:yes gene_type:complete
MKIGVFAYNFPHWKTQEGIHNLVVNGFKPDVILAADPIPLNFPQSKIRISPKDLYLTHPKKIAESYSIDYHVIPHNSQQALDLIKQYDLDLGVILGARILKPMVINGFKTGVLNMHPGILPQNRGLDNIKWAIIDDLPQGVTTHLIDGKIDRGLFIEKSTIEIYTDDTLLDIHLRIQNKEQQLMISALNTIQNVGIGSVELSEGNYYKAVPYEIEQYLMETFESYKQKHSS